ncbi:MAG: arsenate reductase ArsC [Anaerolineaceae bacterium]|nr:arsenate reductase ArsC [Anaerolineaceae bacterium]
MTEKMQVLILCTANSARSQMSEGLLRGMAGDRFEVYSAGSEPSVVNPYAIRVMAEEGIDISRHTSKKLTVFLEKEFDYVITVCDNAAKNCPNFAGKAKRIHWGLADPAGSGHTDEEHMQNFRNARDQLKTHLQEWLKAV